jgi:hypothetical protein
VKRVNGEAVGDGGWPHAGMRDNNSESTSRVGVWRAVACISRVLLQVGSC